MGRAVIAMAAIRSGTCVAPGKITDHLDIGPPTDATPSRPYLKPQPTLRSPVSL